MNRLGFDLVELTALTSQCGATIASLEVKVTPPRRYLIRPRMIETGPLTLTGDALTTVSCGRVVTWDKI